MRTCVLDWNLSNLDGYFSYMSERTNPLLDIMDACEAVCEKDATVEVLSADIVDYGIYRRKGTWVIVRGKFQVRRDVLDRETREGEAAARRALNRKLLRKAAWDFQQERERAKLRPAPIKAMESKPAEKPAFDVESARVKLAAWTGKR